MNTNNIRGTAQPSLPSRRERPPEEMLQRILGFFPRHNPQMQQLAVSARELPQQLIRSFYTDIMMFKNWNFVLKVFSDPSDFEHFKPILKATKMLWSDGGGRIPYQSTFDVRPLLSPSPCRFTTSGSKKRLSVEHNILLFTLIIKNHEEALRFLLSEQGVADSFYRGKVQKSACRIACKYFWQSNYDLGEGRTISNPVSLDFLDQDEHNFNTRLQILDILISDSRFDATQLPAQKVTIFITELKPKEEEFLKKLLLNKAIVSKVKQGLFQKPYCIPHHHLNLYLEHKAILEDKDINWYDICQSCVKKELIHPVLKIIKKGLVDLNRTRGKELWILVRSNDSKKADSLRALLMVPKNYDPVKDNYRLFAFLAKLDQPWIRVAVLRLLKDKRLNPSALNNLLLRNAMKDKDYDLAKLVVMHPNFQLPKQPLPYNGHSNWLVEIITQPYEEMDTDFLSFVFRSRPLLEILDLELLFIQSCWEPEKIKLFLSDTNVNPACRGNRALLQACQRPCNDVIEALLQRKEVNLSCVNNEALYALVSNIISPEQFESVDDNVKLCIKTLVTHGANLAFNNNELLKLAEESRPELAQYLRTWPQVKRQQRVDRSQQPPMVAMKNSIVNGNLSAISKYLELGGDPFGDAKIPDLLITEKPKDYLDLLRKCFDLNIHTKEEAVAALKEATRRGDNEAAKLLKPFALSHKKRPLENTEESKSKRVKLNNHK